LPLCNADLLCMRCFNTPHHMVLLSLLHIHSAHLHSHSTAHATAKPSRRRAPTIDNNSNPRSN
jgi:hypothetical protein